MCKVVKRFGYGIVPTITDRPKCDQYELNNLNFGPYTFIHIPKEKI